MHLIPFKKKTSFFVFDISTNFITVFTTKNNEKKGKSETINVKIFSTAKAKSMEEKNDTKKNKDILKKYFPRAGLIGFMSLYIYI